MSPGGAPRRAQWKGAPLQIARIRALATVGVVAAIAFILVATLTPAAAGPRGCALGIPCTLGHALAFAMLGVPLAALYATSRLARMAPYRALVMLLCGVWIFAALDEMVQAQVGRDASVLDWLADMAGAIIGLLAGSFVLRRWLARLDADQPPNAERERVASPVPKR